MSGVHISGSGQIGILVKINAVLVVQKNTVAVQKNPALNWLKLSNIIKYP